MINMGTEISGYRVIAMANGYALAESKTAPNPFVVWTVDDDGEGVCVGHYFNEREDAEWDFCASAFEWFEDNVNITFTEVTAALEENEPLHEYLDGIKEARETVAKAAQMVEEMCDELDRLKINPRVIKNAPPEEKAKRDCFTVPVLAIDKYGISINGIYLPGIYQLDLKDSGDMDGRVILNMELEVAI